ncbi:1-acyl-sn-glycerol-3-phosphate acyltransferase [Mycoplasmopsis mucosicanis]|uniref:1-acyl-sn-glycerol-3-phosphate acyltransferase n=2 Tax=Mycoplasmopsis mucosicanis TaxID=458208 RepID=A0A507SXP9_9BACT|nr:1-acyl-sn-glycerol-3-phosphate acyltransferase [Mycoplasmopsis mucosicanis]
MSFTFKMIFLWWHFLWCMWRLNANARKYRRLNDEFPLQRRSDYLLKRVKQLLWYFNVKVDVSGLENLPKAPAILMPNHKSNIDPLLIIAALEKKDYSRQGGNKIATFLAKIELQKRRIVRNTLELIDTVFINRANPRQSVLAIKKLGDFVKTKKTYGVVFPEGTRIKEDGLGEFKGGAVAVAQSHYLPIVPVAISDTRDALNKHRHKKLIIKVEFLKSLKPVEFIKMERQSIANKVKESIEKVLKNE